jgi:large subunit ribosomal protein L7/L12
MIQPSRLLLAKISVASPRLVQSQRRLLTCVAQYKQTKQLSASRYGRSLHATPALSHLVHKDFEKAQPTPEERSETEDTIPEWQNPLHHNNSDMKKMFPEDFPEGEELPVLPLPPLSTDDPDKVVAPPHIHDLAHEVVNLTLLELKELTNQIADHFGFDDDVMAASYGGGAAAAAPAAEEVEEKKILFDVKLVGFDTKAKIKVIKEVRAIGGLGLKEAKELVESAPKVIQKDLSQEKADELKAQLEAIGAQVEIV